MAERTDHPIEEWTDEELRELQGRLEAGDGTVPGGLEPQMPTPLPLERLEEELRRRGLQPDAGSGRAKDGR